MKETVELDDGVYGRRATVRSPWSADIARTLKEHAVVELVLNHAKGWRGDNVSFLAELPELLAFDILDLKVKNIEPVHQLHQLRRLGITTYCSTPLSFAAFPHLEDCALEWRAKATSLFDRITLRRLFVNSYTGRDLDQFARLTALQSLAVLNAPVENVRGLAALTALRQLRLANLKRLASLAGLEQLVNIEELEIHTCPGIRTIDEVGHLSMLRKLSLNNDGAIESLKPLAKLQRLEWILFYESTNILDGDLSPLVGQKRLSRVSFKNRPHYSHRREDFGATYSGVSAR